MGVGLELVAASDGALRRGTVYVTLGRMEEKGLLSSRCEDAPQAGGGLPRRLYRPTEQGHHLLTALTALHKRLVPGFAR